jgi:hypothetical protein
VFPPFVLRMIVRCMVNKVVVGDDKVQGLIAS